MAQPVQGSGRRNDGVLGPLRRLALAWLAALTLLGLPLGAAAAAADADTDAFAEARAFLVEQVVEHARLAGPVTGDEALDPAILDAIRTLPRHLFVEPDAMPYAYFDVALPAEHGLRESQPFVVALMTDVVAIEPGHDVLILGVGGGYHAALASRLDARVHAVDLDVEAVTSVAARLAEYDFPGIELRAADPYDGWPELGLEFDAIIVRLAIDRVPPMLYRQLAPGGRLVAPIGRADDGQVLTLMTREPDGSFATRPILPVRFMRLPGGERL
jgi:protein-L-isoaspartate(D-aspartate) O-methyltransferase